MFRTNRDFVITAILICISGFSFPAAMQHDIQIRDDFGLIEEYCPNTHRCDGEYEFEPVRQRDARVCTNCSCTVDCRVYGNCCYDVERTMDPDTQYVTSDGYSCASAVLDKSNYVFFNPSRSGYLLLSTCEQFDDMDVVNKCFYSNLYEFTIPVYSLSTKRVYKNVYCAICNGDGASTEPFSTMMFCSMLTLILDAPPENLPFFDMLEEFSANSPCVVYTVPDKNIPVETCILPEYVISECKPMDKDTPVYTDLCQAGDFVPVVSEGKIFRNVYCAFCNFEYEPEFGTDFSRFEDHFGMTVLLNYLDIIDVIDVLKEEGANNMCRPHETFVEKTRECLNVTCALSELRMSTGCVSLVRVVQKVYLDFRFDILATPGKIPTSERMRQDVYELLNVTSVLIDIRTDLVPSPRLGLTKSQIGASIYVSERQDVLAEYERVLKRIEVFNKRLANDDKGYKYSIGNAPLTGVSVTNVGFVSYLDMSSTLPSIAMSPFQFCEGVMFTDYLVNYDGTITVHDTIFLSSEYIFKEQSSETQAVYICLSTYINRKQTMGIMVNSAVRGYSNTLVGAIMLIGIVGSNKLDG